jgi:hypothetical protein
MNNEFSIDKKRNVYFATQNLRKSLNFSKIKVKLCTNLENKKFIISFVIA